MKRILTVLSALAIAAALLLTGCGKPETVVGKWKGTVNLAEVWNQGLQSALSETGMNADPLKVSSFNLDLIMEFTEDGAYSVAWDKESAKKSLEGLRPTLESGMRRMLEEAIQKANPDLTLEDYLNNSGMSLEDMVEEIISSANMDELVDELVDSEADGTYAAKDGKLFFGDSGADEVKEDEYMEYSFDGGKLILDNPHSNGALDSDFLSADQFFPITLTRI